MSVENSEHLSTLLRKRKIPDNVLNALPKYAAREAEIVAQAGRKHAITISTNMAGRGTDIILGGNPKASVIGTSLHEGLEVKRLGGLHVIGTSLHESRRIDNQLRGRAGRHGDPGSTRFMVRCMQGVVDEISFNYVDPQKHPSKWFLHKLLRDFTGFAGKILNDFFSEITEEAFLDSLVQLHDMGSVTIDDFCIPNLPGKQNPFRGICGKTASLKRWLAICADDSTK